MFDLLSSSADSTYTQQVADAMAAFAVLAAMLVVIYAVIRVTYMVLRIFAASYALLVTAAIVGGFVLIGLLNR